MGAETGVIEHKLGKAEDCQPPPEVRKEEGKDSALAFSEGMRPWWHLDVRLPASRTVGEVISVVFSQVVCGSSLQQPRKLIETPIHRHSARGMLWEKIKMVTGKWKAQPEACFWYSGITVLTVITEHSRGMSWFITSHCEKHRVSALEWQQDCREGEFGWGHGGQAQGGTSRQQSCFCFADTLCS